MTKIIKNTYRFFRSASTYKSLLGMRKQQMYSFALEKWKKSTAGPQFCKRRHQACFSMLVLHNLCCFYFCNINWAHEGFGWEGFGVGILVTEYSLEVIQTLSH